MQHTAATLPATKANDFEILENASLFSNKKAKERNNNCTENNNSSISLYSR